MKKIVAIIAMALVLVSCDHKDLWVLGEPAEENVIVKLHYVLEWHRPYVVADSVEKWLYWIDDWPAGLACDSDSLCPRHPRYCRMVTESGNRQMMSIFDGDEGRAGALTAGMNMLFYNIDTEYIVYKDKDKLSTLTASTNLADGSLSAVANVDSLGDEAVYKQPDVVFSSKIVSFSDSVLRNDTLHVVLKPLVWSYVVEVDINENLDKVRRARGYMTRLAKSVKVAEHATNDDTMTVGFSMNVCRAGVCAIVKSFGIPRYNPDSPTLPPAPGCRLIVVLTLTNGRTVTQKWNIDNQMLAQPAGGVITPGAMTIPKDSLVGGNAGFDVDVDGWGDPHNYNLDL